MPIYSSRPKGPATGDLSGSYPNPQVIGLSGSATGSFTGLFNGSLSGTASYAATALTASYVNLLTQSVYIQGGLSASAGVTGSFSGSAAYLKEVQISDYLRLLPVGAINIPTNQSASYIYTSGSTNDMYFTQYSPPYTNTTRLRWLEGALNTGLLHGGIISTTNGTNTFGITSGSGLIVSFNAFTGSDPYPTINFVNFTGSSNIPLQYSSSAQITYVSMDTNGHVVQKTTPPTFSDFKTSIVLGRVLHQSGSVTNGAINTPPTAYGVNSNVADFVRAIGPLKINGHYLAASGSTTLALTKTSGDSYVEGRNYSLDPNIPNIVLAANDLAVTVTKIFRQYMSGSTPIINTNNNAGYPTLDAEHYQLPNGTTGSVGTDFTVQRIFWFPRAVNNALFAYYGQAKYASLDDAIAGVSTENFVEGDNTKTSAILVGYVIIKGNETNFNSAATSRIYQAGLFRGGAGGGGGVATGGATNLSSLTDVQIGSPFTEGQALVWSTSANKWVDGNPAYATSAGSAATSSYVNPLTQSVYVQGNLSASSGITGSFSGSSANLNLFSTTNGGRGVVPGSNNSSSFFLKGDGTWSAVGGVLAGGTTNYIPKWSSANALTNSLIYDDGINVGIGKSSPTYELDVSGSIRSTGITYGNTGLYTRLLKLSTEESGSTLTGSIFLDGTAKKGANANLYIKNENIFYPRDNAGIYITAQSSDAEFLTKPIISERLPGNRTISLETSKYYAATDTFITSSKFTIRNNVINVSSSRDYDYYGNVENNDVKNFGGQIILQTERPDSTLSVPLRFPSSLTINTENIYVTGTFINDIKMYAGAGIQFGTTYSGVTGSRGANDSLTLSDYEEGLWTPLLVAEDNNMTITGLKSSGSYIKIGNDVTCYGYINLSGATTTVPNFGSALQISGLPFSSKNTPNIFGGLSTFNIEGFNSTEFSGNPWVGEVQNNGSKVTRLKHTNDSGYLNLYAVHSNSSGIEYLRNGSNGTTAFKLQFMVKYRT